MIQFINGTLNENFNFISSIMEIKAVECFKKFGIEYSNKLANFAL